MASLSSHKVINYRQGLRLAVRARLRNAERVYILRHFWTLFIYYSRMAYALTSTYRHFNSFRSRDNHRIARYYCFLSQNFPSLASLAWPPDRESSVFPLISYFCSQSLLANIITSVALVITFSCKINGKYEEQKI